MVSGPARLAEIERSIAALQQRVDTLAANQERELEAIRTQVRSTLDDLDARVSTVGASDTASRETA